MKKILLVLTLSAITCIAFSQDNIVFKNGDEINAKISEVGESNIKYRKFNNLDGPIYTKSKDEIFYIKYSNGEKEMFTDNVYNKSSNNTINKKILISGASIFNYTNTFENDDWYSTSNLNLTASVGGFLTRNFVLGGSLSFQNISTGSNSNSAVAIGPFIRGYADDFYSQVGYGIGKDLNVFSVGLGYQVFLNNSESVSLNPTFIYFTRNYEGYDSSQNGILIGCSFEIHL
jgi:hypothetical protein